MKLSSSSSSVSGFSLIELMIVLAIAGILATIAVPSFSGMIQNQRVRTASFELFSSLSLARSEAIKRNSNVTLTATMNAANEVSWVITAADGTKIRKQDFIKNIRIQAAGLAGTQIVYNRNGRPALTASSATFQIDAAGVSTPTQYVRCVSLELSGMPRTSMGVCPP